MDKTEFEAELSLLEALAEVYAAMVCTKRQTQQQPSVT
jgi:hypothetical protein